MTRRSWLQIVLAAALVLSVVANFFLAGYVFRQHRTGFGLGPGMVAEALVRAYPQEVRKEFRKLLRENRQQAFGALRELRQARRALAETATATPYVQSDVEQALARVRDATDALQDLIQELLLEALEKTRQAA
jgi:uncharacterized membrane protein